VKKLEILGDIIIIILLIGTYFHQKQKIGALETQIKSQGGILESAKTFLNLFDLEKLKGYAEIREEKVKVEMEIKIKEIKKELDERMEKEKERQEAINIVGKEFTITLTALLKAFLLLSSPRRKTVILQMSEGLVKSQLIKTDQKLDEIEISARKEALLSLLKSGEENKTGG
jgi:hypothetical protein